MPRCSRFARRAAPIIEDKRVMRIVRWGAIILGSALLLASFILLTRRALKHAALWRSAGGGALAAAPDEVAMEKLRALRLAMQRPVRHRRLSSAFYFALATRSFPLATSGAALPASTRPGRSQRRADGGAGKARAAPHHARRRGGALPRRHRPGPSSRARGSTDAAALGARSTPRRRWCCRLPRKLEKKWWRRASPVRLPLDGAGHG